MRRLRYGEAEWPAVTQSVTDRRLGRLLFLHNCGERKERGRGPRKEASERSELRTWLGRPRETFLRRQGGVSWCYKKFARWGKSGAGRVRQRKQCASRGLWKNGGGGVSSISSRLAGAGEGARDQWWRPRTFPEPPMGISFVEFTVPSWML
jgi:hypothetical protein